MNQDNILKLYQVVDKSCQMLSEELNISYLDSLAETLQNLLFDQKANVIDGLPSKEIEKRLNDLYASVSLSKINSETIRKTTQLSFLQAIKVDGIQTNHYITPDSIAYFISFLVMHLVAAPIKLLDVSAGAGNLVSVLQEKMSDRLHSVQVVEIDEVLVSILATNTQLQRYYFDIRHQDSVLPLLVDTPNVIVSDLPIGYYPNDTIVEDFIVSVKNEHTYAHHALIENSLSILENNGWAFYLVPSNLFNTNQSAQLMQLLTNHDYYLQGFLILPQELFKNEASTKAVLMVQKKGNNAKQVENVLLGSVPSFKDAVAFKEFMETYINWTSKIMKI